jgi:hypothetical protein
MHHQPAQAFALGLRALAAVLIGPCVFVLRRCGGGGRRQELGCGGVHAGGFPFDALFKNAALLEYCYKP